MIPSKPAHRGNVIGAFFLGLAGLSPGCVRAILVNLGGEKLCAERTCCVNRSLRPGRSYPLLQRPLGMPSIEDGRIEMQRSGSLMSFIRLRQQDRMHLFYLRRPRKRPLLKRVNLFGIFGHGSKLGPLHRRSGVAANLGVCLGDFFGSGIHSVEFQDGPFLGKIIFFEYRCRRTFGVTSTTVNALSGWMTKVFAPS